jgi:hypothetical protein
MLKEECKSLDEQKSLAKKEISDEREALEKFKEVLYQREKDFLSEKEEHRKLMMKEENRLELQKVSLFYKVNLENFNLSRNE